MGDTSHKVGNDGVVVCARKLVAQDSLAQTLRWVMWQVLKNMQCSKDGLGGCCMFDCEQSVLSPIPYDDGLRCARRYRCVK